MTMTDRPLGTDLLVSTEWLASQLGRIEAGEVVLVDAGEAVAYRRAHIPGAVGVPHPYLKAAGSPLVMPPEEFEALARSWGVSDDTPVLVYDDNASLHATRVWWVFRRYGHANVRVVNGGFNAWLDEGRPLTSQAPRPAPGSFTASDEAACVVLADDLKREVEAGSAGAIWDTRSPEEWTEQTSSRRNKRAGHVPGAPPLEWRELLQGPPARRFRAPEELRSMLEARGIDPAAQTVTYCQGGIRAAFGAFVLALLGNDSARVYDGSMAEWANREDTPLAPAEA